MPRPTAEDRRRDYLAIGAEIVTNFSAEESRAATVDALANVKVADVAERAGVTKGAVYHVWPSQEEYRKDLLARLLDQNRQAGVRELLSLLSDADLLENDPRGLLHRFADFAFAALKDDPAYYARFSFFVYAENPDVAELLSASIDTMLEDFGPLMGVFLSQVGRRVRKPYTMEMMLVAINSLFQGLCLRYRASPDLVERQIGPEGLSMYAHGLESIAMHFSEPIPDADVTTPDEETAA